jgi:ERF superfamily
MGAALTYARRYALFALVGIAGEDDLDAPDLLVDPSPTVHPPEDPHQNRPILRKSSNGSIHKPRQPKPMLSGEPSAVLRDQLVAEIKERKSADDLALWAHRSLPAKNTLTAVDARAVEVAYQAALGPASRQVDEPVSPLHKTTQKRNKAHLRFVAAQPCLVCQRTPCDAHHIKFAEPRALGRKVSDEFTVPLCRDHHRHLHHHGNEIAWWGNVRITPLEVAEKLWQKTLDRSSADLAQRRPARPSAIQA